MGSYAFKCHVRSASDPFAHESGIELPLTTADKVQKLEDA